MLPFKLYFHKLASGRQASHHIDKLNCSFRRLAPDSRPWLDNHCSGQSRKIAWEVLDLLCLSRPSSGLWVDRRDTPGVVFDICNTSLLVPPWENDHCRNRRVAYGTDNIFRHENWISSWDPFVAGQRQNSIRETNTFSLGPGVSMVP